MGNRSSTVSEPSLSSYSPRDDLYSPVVTAGNRNLPGHNSPPTFVKRTLSVSERQRISDYVPEVHRSGSDASSYKSHYPVPHVLSPVVETTSDDLSKHVLEFTPTKGDQQVSLGAQICVTFDKDVKLVSVNKLFEVSCDSVDQSLNPITGTVNCDQKQVKVEFRPSNTFLPNAQYTVVLRGKAVTTTQCSQVTNIKDVEFTFRTCNPSPKKIGIKLKGDIASEQLQIASYYDLYNSLILWCTKKWGCSGEHISSMHSEGRSLSIKSDLDVLNVNENEVIVVEVKD